MKQLAFLGAVILILSGCEKDPVVTSSGSESLESYLESFHKDAVVHRLGAHAGAHRSFKTKESDDIVQIQFQMIDSAEAVRLYVSDSLNDPLNLTYYRKHEAEEHSASDGVVSWFSTPELRRRAQYAIIAVQRKDSAYLSLPILLPARGSETQTIDRLTVTCDELGNATFYWSGSGEAVKYFFVLRDATGDAICAHYTNTATFAFYDLRNVSHSWTPVLLFPKLVSNEWYSAEVYSVTEDNWIIRQRRNLFQVNSQLGQQVFE